MVSLVAEGAAQSVASLVDTGDLASVSRRDLALVEFGGLLAWRIALMALYWFGDFDGMFTYTC